MPVSKCGKVGVRDNLEFYKRHGYDGVFITNHFLDGNINISPDVPYDERIEFYCSDYEEAAELGKEIGIKVFFGVEMSYGGTDFLVYGLDKAWYFSHPEIMEMNKSRELQYLMDNGALVIQAHPFREARYIDHIRLFPRQVHGVEVINGCRKEEENAIAKLYAAHYGLLEFAGTDNHEGKARAILAGVSTEKPINSVEEFINAVMNKEINIFSYKNEEVEL